ncbi:C-24(28) sterol reductase, partial [Ceratobasidium sp. UAMH 11750]
MAPSDSPTERTPLKQQHPTSEGQKSDARLDVHEHYEFGGPIGVTAMMLFFPVLMYYFWICLRFYDGALVHPDSLDDFGPFLGRMWVHVREYAFPSFTA